MTSTSIDRSKIVANSSDMAPLTDKATADKKAESEYMASQAEEKASKAKIKSGMKTETIFISPVVLSESKQGKKQ